MGQCRGNRFGELDFNCIWILCSSYPKCNCCEMWHWWTIVVLISVAIKELLQHCNHSWQCTTFLLAWHLFGKPCFLSASYLERLAGCHIQLGVVKVSHRDGKLLQMSWFHEEEAVKCHNFLLKAVECGDFAGSCQMSKRRWSSWRSRWNCGNNFPWQEVGAVEISKLGASPKEQLTCDCENTYERGVFLK